MGTNSEEYCAQSGLGKQDCLQPGKALLCMLTTHFMAGSSKMPGWLQRKSITERQESFSGAWSRFISPNRRWLNTSRCSSARLSQKLGLQRQPARLVRTGRARQMHLQVGEMLSAWTRRLEPTSAAYFWTPTACILTR